MVHFYTLSKNDTWARDRVGILILLMEMKVNVWISFDYFRRLHWLFWNSEEGWTKRQREERGGGNINICTSLHHWDLGLGATARWEGYLNKVKMCGPTNDPVVAHWYDAVPLLLLLLFYAFLFPSRVINTVLTADGFTTPKCRLARMILTI